MLHILAFTLVFPAMCLFVFAALGRFQMVTDLPVLLTGFRIAYAVTTAPGLITAIADYLLSRRSIRFRFLYCALVAAIVTPTAALWFYPGSPPFFWPNVVFFASIGAASAILCSWLIGRARSLFGHP